VIRVAGVALIVVVGVAGNAASAAPRAETRCTAAQTRTLLVSLTRAWTRGDAAAVDRLVVREPLFRWFSVAWAGGRMGPGAFERTSLRRYIASRGRMHERIVLRSFRFHGSDVRGGHRYGHYELTAYRDADDWPSAIHHVRPGKGAIMCSLPRPGIAVFALG
jgi:hypothetical protein